MESRLQQIRSDPNFSYDLTSIARAKKNPKFTEVTVITPDREDASRFQVFQKRRFPQGVYFFSGMLEKYRSLRVTKSGEIEIYDDEKRVAENPELYLFSDRAINIYEQIKNMGFYHSFETNRYELYKLMDRACLMPHVLMNEEDRGLRYRQHCETLDLYYKSSHTGQMKVENLEANVAAALYILSVNRNGDVSYELRYRIAFPEIYSWCAYTSVDEIQDPKVKEFHEKHVAPLLGEKKHALAI